jgi:hypothetical protein
VAKRNDRASNARPKPKQSEPKPILDYAIISAKESAPALGEHAPQRYQVREGTAEEIVACLQEAPEGTRHLLIGFETAAAYEQIGPIYRELLERLPEIVKSIRQRQIERLADALMTEPLRTRPK